MEPQDETSDRLLGAITECLGKEGGVVTGFVVIANFVSADGLQNIYGDTMVDQPAHQTLGLLHYGVAVETRRIQDDYSEPDE